MIRSSTALAALLVAPLLLAPSAFAQAPASPPRAASFEVATIKRTDPDAKAGRYFRMEGPHRWIASNYTLKLLIAAAYDLNPSAISGGPDWVDAAHFDIVALTPGDVAPARDEQMTLLRGLLADRFRLAFHRQSREFSLYELQIAKGGPKLKQSTAQPTDPPKLLNIVDPQKIVLPARNATMQDFVFMLQRALLDRPVVDKTGLTARYDFDLEWAPDETQFGGEVPSASADAPSPPLFTALQQQLGLRLVATRGPVDALILDKAVQPVDD